MVRDHDVEVFDSSEIFWDFVDIVNNFDYEEIIQTNIYKIICANQHKDIAISADQVWITESEVNNQNYFYDIKSDCLIFRNISQMFDHLQFIYSNLEDQNYLYSIRKHMIKKSIDKIVMAVQTNESEDLFSKLSL